MIEEIFKFLNRQGQKYLLIYLIKLYLSGVFVVFRKSYSIKKYIHLICIINSQPIYNIPEQLDLNLWKK